MNFLDERLPLSFWDRLIPCPMSGCWLWIGYTVSSRELSYGRIKYAGKHTLVHRLTYQVANGNIATGLVIDHLCRVSECANPFHLEAVSQQTNVLRGDGVAAQRARKTHCIRGHELSGDNVRVYERSPGRFMRTCLICVRAFFANRKKAS